MKSTNIFPMCSTFDSYARKEKRKNGDSAFSFPVYPLIQSIEKNRTLRVLFCPGSIIRQPDHAYLKITLLCCGSEKCGCGPHQYKKKFGGLVHSDEFGG